VLRTDNDVKSFFVDFFSPFLPVLVPSHLHTAVIFPDQLVHAVLAPPDAVELDIPHAALLYFFDLKFDDFECDLLVRLGHCSAGLCWAVLA
jgi:hypothetical protein